MHLGQMAKSLGPCTEQQATRCETSDTPMKVLLLLCPLGRGLVNRLSVDHTRLIHFHHCPPTHLLCVLLVM
jgi:hypothetical protein